MYHRESQDALSQEFCCETRAYSLPLCVTFSACLYNYLSCQCNLNIFITFYSHSMKYYNYALMPGRKCLSKKITKIVIPFYIFLADLMIAMLLVLRSNKNIKTAIIAT